MEEKTKDSIKKEKPTSDVLKRKPVGEEPKSAIGALKRKPVKKYNKWAIVSLLLLLLLAGSIVTRGFGLMSLVPSKSADAIAKSTIDYINKNLLQDGMTATLVGISKEPTGLYKLKFKLQEQEIESYVSSDGNILFPQAFEMKNMVVKSGNQGSNQEIPKTEKPDVKLFVMSYCPYGNQAEDAMMPVIDLLKDKFNITLNYIASKSGDSYKSLHGQNELDQDIREMCVQKYEQDKFWSFIEEMNAKTTLNDAADKWEEIAKGLGIDTERIKTCQKNEASTLLDAEIELMSKYKVSGSPTLIINDTVFSGTRTSNGYKEGICSGFQVVPDDCGTELSSEGASASSGGCGGN